MKKIRSGALLLAVFMLLQAALPVTAAAPSAGRQQRKEDADYGDRSISGSFLLSYLTGICCAGGAGCDTGLYAGLYGRRTGEATGQFEVENNIGTGNDLQ